MGGRRGGRRREVCNKWRGNEELTSFVDGRREGGSEKRRERKFGNATARGETVGKGFEVFSGVGRHWFGLYAAVVLEVKDETATVLSLTCKLLNVIFLLFWFSFYLTNIRRILVKFRFLLVENKNGNDTILSTLFQYNNGWMRNEDPTFLWFLWTTQVIFS